MQDVLSNFLKKSTSRRFSIKYFASVLASFFAFLYSSHSKAEKICESQSDIKEDLNPVSLKESEFFYWLDMPLYGGKSQLAIYFKRSIQRDEYIKRVVFTDQNNRSLAIRYFNPTEADLSTSFPYIILSSLNIYKENSYYLWVLKGRSDNKKSSVLRYTFDTSNIIRSTSKKLYLSNKIKDKFLKRGMVEIASQFFIPTSVFNRSVCGKTSVCLDENRLRARFKSVKSEDFELEIEFNKKQKGISAFGSFLLCDPVGRVLAYKDSTHLHKLDDALGFKLALLSKEEASDWGISSEYLASIDECPYVILIWEDLKLGLRKHVIQLV